MKKFSVLIFMLVSLALALSGCKVSVEDPVVHVRSVKVTGATSLFVGEEATFSAAVLPEDATDKSVVWSSSNKAVATVDQEGHVKAVAEGGATITATSTDGAKSSSVTLTVTKQKDTESQGDGNGSGNTHPGAGGGENNTPSDNSGEGGTGGSENGNDSQNDTGNSENGNPSDNGNTQEAPSTPVYATDWSKLDWAGDGAGGGAYSNKYKFWAKDGAGSLVNIQKPGFASEAGLYVTFGSGISSCSLEGYNADGAGIILHLLNFTEGENEFTVTTAAGTYTCYVLYSPDGKFGNDNSSGNNGSVSTGNDNTGGKENSGGVEPSADLTGISITGPSSVKVTSQINLAASPVPAGATLGTVTWTSSNESVAVVSNKGTVTGLSTGTVTITAKCGEFTATKAITVTEDVDPESLVQSSSDITPEAGRTVPFGVVLDGNVGNGQFTICSGGGMNPMPSYWDLFITGGDYTDKKVILRTNGVVGVTVGKSGTYTLKLYNVWVEDGVPHYSEPWEGSVSVNSSKAAVSLPADAEARLANRTLVQKKDTTTLTLQFENNTGYWTDEQIWVTGYGRNAIGEWCYLNKDGTAIPITAGTTSADWSFRFSEVDKDWGLQVKDFSSSRIYFTCGSEPVTMNAVIDGDGNVGVAQPNMAIENDANATKYFDWIEFTSGGVLYVNTTQVDAFTFPIVVADYADDGMGGYEWKKSVGVTKSRAEVFAAWNEWTNTYTHYKNLVRCNGTRILAPCKVPKSDFDMTYMDSYIADVWNYYKTHDLHYSEAEHGTYTGRVYEIQGVDGNTKNVLIMTRQGDGKKFYVYDTPNMEEAFEGSGKLAMDCSPGQSVEWFGTEAYGNTETSKNVQNRICSAFTRHAFIKQGDDYINVMDEPDRYYSEEPANMYSAFFHKKAGNLDGYAYGFAYDDNHDQSTTTVDGNCRGVVVGIGRWQ